MIRVFIQGLRYFALVFSAGLGFGVMRTLWVVPLLGTRWAELTEMPLMLGVIIWVARGLVQPKGEHSDQRLNSEIAYWGIGGVALVCMVLADLAVGVGLRGMTIDQALFERDPISGSFYYLMLLIFAIMPGLWAKWLQRLD